MLTTARHLKSTCGSQSAKAGPERVDDEEASIVGSHSPYSDNRLAGRVEPALAVDAAMRQTVTRAAERQARSSSLTEREHEAMQRVATGLRDKLLADELQVSSSLTEREHEAMQRVATGLLDKLLADELQVSERTFEGHRARVDARLSVLVRSSGDAAGGMTVISAVAVNRRSAVTSDRSVINGVP